MRRFAIAALLTALAGVAVAAETQAPPPPPSDGHQCERTKGEAQTS